MVPFSCSSRMARDRGSRHRDPLGVAIPYLMKKTKSEMGSPFFFARLFAQCWLLTDRPDIYKYMYHVLARLGLLSLFRLYTSNFEKLPLDVSGYPLLSRAGHISVWGCRSLYNSNVRKLPLDVSAYSLLSSRPPYLCEVAVPLQELPDSLQSYC